MESSQNLTAFLFLVKIIMSKNNFKSYYKFPFDLNFINLEDKSILLKFFVIINVKDLLK